MRYLALSLALTACGHAAVVAAPTIQSVPVSKLKKPTCSEEAHMSMDKGDIVCPPGMGQHVKWMRVGDHLMMLTTCDCPTSTVTEEDAPFIRPPPEGAAL